MYDGHETLAGLHSASLSAKITLLVLEAIEKGSYLGPSYRWATPETLSSIYNKSVFWWLNRLFRLGYKKAIAFEDLYDLDLDLRSETVANQMRTAWEQTDKGSKYSLLRAVVVTLKWPLLAPAIPRLLLIGFNYSQPFLVNRAITFVGDSQNANYEDAGYGLIAAGGIIYVGLAALDGRYKHLIYRSMTMLRGTLVSLIYEKSLELKVTRIEEATPVSPMSTDVDSVVRSVDNIHEIWASTIEVGIGIYLLERQAGIGCIVPIILVVGSTIVNSFWVGPEMGKRCKAWNEAIQRRIALTSSALRGVKTLKMSGLAVRLKSLLQSQRSREMEYSRPFRWMIIWNNTVASLSEIISPAFVLMVYTLNARLTGNHPLTAAQGLTILSLLNLMTNPLIYVLVSIPGLMSSIACLDRIQRYLLEGSREDDRLVGCHVDNFSSEAGLEMHNLMNEAKAGDEVIILDDVAFGFDRETATVGTLSSRIKAGSITMIVGPIGSGKSSLLLGLLGEIPSIKGFVRMTTANIGYCQQSAWLMNGTLRDIITGPLPFEAGWYSQVTHSCGLDYDIGQFPEGDQSLIGSRGLTLSGGQRQRLALARAVYARKPIVLLDDIFSALDARTEHLVFEQLFSTNGLFRRQRVTVILATHAVHHLHAADHVIALNKDGKLVQQGSFQDVMSVEGYIKSLSIEGSRKSVQEVDDGQQKPGSHSNPQTRGIQAGDVSDSIRRIGDRSVYNYYRKQLEWSHLLPFIFMQFIAVAFRAIPSLWVQWWTAENGRHGDMYMSVMFVFAFAAECSNIAGLWLILCDMTPRTGKRLHWILLSTILAAPLGYFTSTDAGVILNRFSQDMTIVDGSLPVALLQFVSTVGVILWDVALICYGSYYLVAFIPVMAATVYGIQRVYLRTSRQLRLLDLEMKSPLFTHFIETLEGLVTIRAGVWQNDFFESFISKLDASQRPYYLLYCIQLWLRVGLGLLVAGVAVVLLAFATQFNHQTSGSAIGIALLNLISFSESLTEIVQHWTQMETSIGAIARLRQLEADVRPEESASAEIISPPKTWPQQGAIDFVDVSASYSLSSPLVINETSIGIRPGDKVGICGRTGSGKSTLISLLFRLLPTSSGIITIDDIDISKVPLETLRKSIISIPQEPFLLSGTIRFNAAPHSASTSTEAEPESSTLLSTNEFPLSSTPPAPSDSAIISALIRVGLWDVISRRGHTLSSSISSLNLSHGQKQLFCLARAILIRHTSNILVLDEATSSVDKHTDQIMRKVIAEEFPQHTVLSVAHRLSSISACDTVIVMEQGRIVETGSPAELTKKAGGEWRALWEVQNGSSSDSADTEASEA